MQIDPGMHILAAGRAGIKIGAQLALADAEADRVNHDAPADHVQYHRQVVQWDVAPFDMRGVVAHINVRPLQPRNTDRRVGQQFGAGIGLRHRLLFPRCRTSGICSARRPANKPAEINQIDLVGPEIQRHHGPGFAVALDTAGLLRDRAGDV